MKSRSGSSMASPLLVPLLALLLSIWIARTIPSSRASPVTHLEKREVEHMEYKRTEFPDYPPSCKLCERDFDNIDSCANASIVFANPQIVSPLEYPPSVPFCLYVDDRIDHVQST